MLYTFIFEVAIQYHNKNSETCGYRDIDIYKVNLKLAYKEKPQLETIKKIIRDHLTFYHPLKPHPFQCTCKSYVQGWSQKSVNGYEYRLLEYNCSTSKEEREFLDPELESITIT